MVREITERMLHYQDGLAVRLRYNDQHFHSGIGHMTPNSVHYGRAGSMRAVRQSTLNAAFLANPNRFKGIKPCLAPMPTAVWINPPTPEVQTNTQHCTVNL